MSAASVQHRGASGGGGGGGSGSAAGNDADGAGGAGGATPAAEREYDPLPPLDDIAKLTSIDAIRQTLAEVKQHKLRVDDELAAVAEAGNNLRIKLEVVEVFPSKLKPIFEEVDVLASRINETMDLANTVRNKVKKLDMIRERLQTTAGKIEDIVDLKECIEGVQDAMEAANYEIASTHIKRYLTIEQSDLLDANSSRLLEASATKLKAIVQRELETAIAAGDTDSIIRFCRLYTPLGMRNEGLSHYSHYLRQRVRAAAQAGYSYLLKSLATQENDAAVPHLDAGQPVTTFVKTVTDLFEFIAELLEEQSPIVDRHFGRGFMLLVLRQLQLEADVHAVKVLELFMRKNKMSVLLTEITKITNVERSEKQQQLRAFHRSSGLNTAAGGARKTFHEKLRELESRAKRGGGGSGGGGGGGGDIDLLFIDLNDINGVLEDVCMFSQRYELYSRFLRKKSEQYTREAEESAEADGSGGGGGGGGVKEAIGGAGGLMHVSELDKRMQELMDLYIGIEQYFMMQSVIKAIDMDELIADSPTSSMIDYIFFVLQRCIQRSILSGNGHSMCAIINIIDQILNDYLLSNLREGVTSSDVRTIKLDEFLMDKVGFGSAKSASRDSDSRRYLIMLNNMEVSSEHIKKIKREIDIDAQRIVTVDGDKQRLEFCLAQLSDTAKQFKTSNESSIRAIAKNFFFEIEKSLLGQFVSNDYSHVTEMEFAEMDAQNFFVQEFTANVSSICVPFKRSLTQTNYELLMGKIVECVIERMERLTLQKRFNQLGALQLDKDVRLVSTFLSDMLMRTIREKFARLQQIVSLLNLDSPAEVLDYWGDNAGRLTWRLSPAEVRRVLALRVDFSPGEIGRLKL